MTWPESVQSILEGDQVVAFALVTPARGAMLTPLTNMGLVDRAAGTITPVTSSIGAWRKLERIDRNPHVAVAYHTRTHAFSDGPEYVLVQGRASYSSLADRGEWIEAHREHWERFAGRRDVGLWERWTSVYHRRVGITVEVERVIVWPDRRCAGAPSMHGAPLPADPPAPQDPPAKGTGPRIAHRRAARRAARRPEVLLAWVGADGFPVVAPVRIAGAEHDGIVLEAAPGIDLPPGGRRAGLLAHAFARYTHGQHQHQHTGWLENRVGRLLYAPHTKHGYWMPRSEAIFRFASGAMTRYGHRGGVRAGFLPG